jgi:hypothetical protein
MGHLIQPDSMMPTPVRGADSTTPTHYSSTEGDAAASTSSRPSSPQSEVHGALGGLNHIQQQFAAYRFGDPGSSETNFGESTRKIASEKYKGKGVPQGLATVLGAAKVAMNFGLRPGKTIEDSAGLRPVRGKTVEEVRKMSTGDAWVKDFQTEKINRDRRVIEQRKGSLPNIEEQEGDPAAELVRVPRKGSLASARDSLEVTRDRWPISEKGKSNPVLDSRSEEDRNREHTLSGPGKPISNVAMRVDSVPGGASRRNEIRLSRTLIETGGEISSHADLTERDKNSRDAINQRLKDKGLI